MAVAALSQGQAQILWQPHLFARSSADFLTGAALLQGQAGRSTFARSGTDAQAGAALLADRLETGRQVDR